MPAGNESRLTSVFLHDGDSQSGFLPSLFLSSIDNQHINELYFISHGLKKVVDGTEGSGH